MPKFPPKVPGVGDLHSLLALLEIAKSRDKWISEAKKILDANQKAVRLLGAEEEIQQALDRADRTKAAAERAMDAARAQSESIVEDAEAKCAKREKALSDREKAFDERMKAENEALAANKVQFDALSGGRTLKQNAMAKKLDDRESNVTSREKAIGAREKRAEGQLETAKSMKADAEAKFARLQAALA